jgi:SAM-dependent methyltransferase
MIDKQIIDCLLCGGDAELRQKELRGYQEPETFNIYHCPGCNTAFSLPRVNTAKVYNDIYKNGDLVPGYERYWKYAKIVKSLADPLEYLSNTEETYWGVKEALLQYVKDKKSSKILEIGCGLGYFTYSLRKANYNVIGLDISQTAVNQANEAFGEYYICSDLFDFVKSNPEQFDIVILTEVIEHIDQPVEFIESIKKLLRTGGLVIITTPNKSLYSSDLIWATELPPVHCWWFSEESMTYIANKLRLQISFINFNRYYKNNYCQIDLKMLHERNSQHPILNKNGELIIQSVAKQNNLKSLLHGAITKVPYLRKILNKLKEFMNPNIIVCSDRGIVICSIFQK